LERRFLYGTILTFSAERSPNASPGGISTLAASPTLSPGSRRAP